MTELDTENRYSELNTWYQAAMRDRERLQAENLKLRAALENLERLRAAVKQALWMYEAAANGTKQQIDFEHAMDALEATLKGRDV